MMPESVDFLTIGLTHYGEAFRAVQHFQRLVQKAAYDALNQGLDELSSALGVEVPKTWIKLYANPGPQQPDTWDWNKTESWWGAWLAAKVSVSGLSNCYAGVAWEPRESIEPASAVVAFDVGAAKKARLLQQIAELTSACRFRTYDTGYELWLSQELKPEDVPNLSNILADIISEWARIFKKIGGVSGLNAAMNQNGA